MSSISKTTSSLIVSFLRRGLRAEFGVQVQVHALIVLKVPSAEYLVAGKLVEGGEDVPQSQDSSEKFDEVFLRTFANDRLPSGKPANYGSPTSLWYSRSTRRTA